MTTFKSARLRIGCWLAMLAMAMLTVLPTITSASGTPGDAGGWADLCSSSGMTGAAPAYGQDGPEAPVHGLASHLDHCAACRITIDAMGLAPAPVIELALPLGSAEPPEAFLEAPHTLHVWRRAQTRGPPTLD